MKRPLSDDKENEQVQTEQEMLKLKSQKGKLYRHCNMGAKVTKTIFTDSTVETFTLLKVKTRNVRRQKL